MAELTVPQINFSALGELPQVYRDARARSAREQTLANLPVGANGQLDYSGAARALLQAGDTQGAMTLASLGNHDRDFSFRQQEAQRSQGNTDRSFALQKQQAEEAARGFDYREIDDGSGGKTLVRINKANGQTEKVNIAGADNQPQNPYVMGKMNEAQSKDALYSSRMVAAEELFRDPGVVSAGQSLAEKGKSKVPLIGNYLVSDNFQKYDQAKRDFINATLRRESGAVIADSEFANAEKQYFPQPGDSPVVLAQKAKNRAEAIRGIAAGAGPGYRPAKVLGPNNEIIANPVGQPKQAVAKTITKAEYDALPPGSPYTAPDGTPRIKK